MRNEHTAELVDVLTHGWNVLRLAAKVPERVPSWDAVVLTAAGEEQAALYERRLRDVRRRGLVAPNVHFAVVPDPEGCRIGSGGATLNALRVLKQSFPDALQAMRILLIHAGGDSKRLPWAGVFGKPFVPFPLLCDPDEAPPTLLDQILAVAAPSALHLAPGSLLTVTGDVLPIWDPERCLVPLDAALVLAKPMSLDAAARHGVIVPGSDNGVQALLQKPAPDEIAAAGALVAGAAALVDTGIYFFTGSAFHALTDLACATPDPVAELLDARAELSLYEELAGAMVPRRPPSLGDCPIEEQLCGTLGETRLAYRSVPELAFLHFGTSAELLEHLATDWHGRLPRRILARGRDSLSVNAFVYASQVERGCRIGDGALILDSRVGPKVRLGNRCIVVNAALDTANLALPPHHCLWQLPVRTSQNVNATVTVFCGVDDNPKAETPAATFCNQALGVWMKHRGIIAADLWDPGEPRTLWTARVFPVHFESGLSELAQWILTGADFARDGASLTAWRAAERLSFAQLHAAVDPDRLTTGQVRHRSALLLDAVEQAVEEQAERDLDALAAQLPTTPEVQSRFADFALRLEQVSKVARVVPASRLLQMRADLAAATGNAGTAERLAGQALQAVQAEVAGAVQATISPPVHDLRPGQRVRVRLPVRFDLAGGWSDTPPYCLERPASVLNFSLTLGGQEPVAVDAETLDVPVWDLTLADSGARACIENALDMNRTGDLSDPFSLLRTALVMTGYGGRHGITQGVRIVTKADVPRGSGLGTSSVLGAALVMALQQLAGRPDDCETVSELVLGLEQLMTTGGGWQDQIGGLAPGLKFISSVPIRPLRVTIETVPLQDSVRREFEQRFVVAFSGQERLAKNVLQMVVRRYLRRDRRLIQAIEELAVLARTARAALALGDLDEVGSILREVWTLHQQLDPHCSNPVVDALFEQIDDLASGFKLAGAGGGGFLGVLAKDADAAGEVSRRLSAMGGGVRVYNWSFA